MKSKIILSSLFCSLYLLASCSSNTVGSNPNALFPQTVKTNQKQTDADILGIMVALDRNEIAVAREAQRKSSNREVRSYAAMLNKQHSSNILAAKRVGRVIGVKPVENQNAQSLRMQGTQEREALAALNRQSFDKTFIADMITDHTNGLHLIDQLSRDTTNATVLNYLKDTRAHVAMHLQTAKNIQQTLPAS